MKTSNDSGTSLTEVVVTLVLFFILWKSGFLDTNFELLLFILTIICGIGFAAEKIFLKKKREKDAKEYLLNEEKSKEILKKQGINRDSVIEEKFKEIQKQPKWVDWTAGLFPILLIIFLARSFIIEPFSIPSGSMMPTLIQGDNIIVKKYEYGLRLPVFDNKLTEGNKVQRGDIVVFHYPLDHKVNFIKRVVGLPGDKILYKNKNLYINEVKQEMKDVSTYVYPDGSGKVVQRLEQTLGSLKHNILIEPETSSTINQIMKEDILKYCSYKPEEIECVVPENNYFMLGDNRDGSLDSRYWGFVPDENLVGKAILIWSNFSNMSRIGSIK